MSVHSFTKHRQKNWREELSAIVADYQQASSDSMSMEEDYLVNRNFERRLDKLFPERTPDGSYLLEEIQVGYSEDATVTIGVIGDDE